MQSNDDRICISCVTQTAGNSILIRYEELEIMPQEAKSPNLSPAGGSIGELFCENIRMIFEIR